MVLVLSSGVAGFAVGSPARVVSSALGLVGALAVLAAMGFVTVLLVRLGAAGRTRSRAPRGHSADVPAPGPPPPRTLVTRRRAGIHLRRPAAPEPAAEPAPTTTEWRFGQFLDLGFEPEGALELAQQDIDVHLVRRLVGRGCPPALAARIEAPIVPVRTPDRGAGRCAS